MKVELVGTGGSQGWPEVGCRCASCGRVGTARRPFSVVVDDNVSLVGHRLSRRDDGDSVVGPDGGSLLFANGELGSEDRGDPYDIVLIDVLERPDRLGDLRRRGLVGEGTQVVAVGLDHRVSSERELERRLGFWGAVAVPDGTVLRTGDRSEPERLKVRAIRRVPPRRTLLLGGSRSGKSAEAELRVAAEPDVTYVATGPSRDDDPDWSARVKTHQARRPAHWRTLETTDLATVLTTETGVLLIDAIGTWLTAVIDAANAWPPSAPSDADTAGDHEAALQVVRRRCDALIDAWRQTTARAVVAVSDEVGLGLIPPTPGGRLFRDLLGDLNQSLATQSEDAALVVTSRVIPLP